MRTEIGLFRDGHRFSVAASDKKFDTGLCSNREADGTIVVTEQGHSYFFTTTPAIPRAGGAVGDGAILAPMPGRITAVEVAAGDSVAKGQRLLTLEAMKMEHGLTAPFDGVVAELNASAGTQVSEGSVLVRVEKAE